MTLSNSDRRDAVQAVHDFLRHWQADPSPGTGFAAAAIVDVLHASGWRPPATSMIKIEGDTEEVITRKPVTEHAQQMSGGGMHIRATYPDQERVYPLAEWIKHCQRGGGKVYRRTVLILDDWTEVPHE